LLSNVWLQASFRSEAIVTAGNRSRNELHRIRRVLHLKEAALGGRNVMTKHQKTTKPTDADLKGNPLIGGSKGTTMAGVTPDELEESEGDNTIEGDVENDTNRQGGIDKASGRNR
jgi:hypothetical protein